MFHCDWIYRKVERNSIIKIDCKQVLITSVSICKVHLKRKNSDDTDYDNDIFEKYATHSRQRSIYTLPVMPVPSQQIVIWPNWKLNYAIYICSTLCMCCTVLCSVLSTLKISQITEAKNKNTQSFETHKQNK